MTMASDTLALLPEIFVLAGAVLTLLAGSFLPRRRQALTRWIALLALAASATASAVALTRPSMAIFDSTFVVDAASGAGRIIIALATFFVIVLGVDELGATAREGETYSLLLLAALGTMVLSGTTDLLILITGYLLSSISLYGLIGIIRSERAAEATLKTYLLGALLGIVMMFGVAVLYGIGGATGYRQLANSLATTPATAVTLGLVGVLGGLMFKAGGFPGHFWIPDAAQAAGRAVAAFLTTVPKVGALIAIYRLVSLLPLDSHWPLLVAVLAAVSMSLGNLAAFWQHDVRRLLGWSTVSQAGYLLLPVAVAGQVRLALPSLLFYLGGYALTNLTAFAVVAALPARHTLDDYRGVARAHPWLAAALVVSLLGFVGTPPTAVFVGKLTTFTATWDGGFAWLVVIAALNSVASLFYYLRWLAPTLRHTTADSESAAFGSWAAGAAVVGAAAVLAAGIGAGFILGALDAVIAG